MVCLKAFLSWHCTMTLLCHHRHTATFILTYEFQNEHLFSFLGLSAIMQYLLACNIIKIMTCVEGDRSDCQPEASSIARSRRLRAMVVVEG